MTDLLFYFLCGSGYSVNILYGVVVGLLLCFFWGGEGVGGGRNIKPYLNANTRIV